MYIDYVRVRVVRSDEYATNSGIPVFPSRLNYYMTETTFRVSNDWYSELPEADLEAHVRPLVEERLPGRPHLRIAYRVYPHRARPSPKRARICQGKKGQSIDVKFFVASPHIERKEVHHPLYEPGDVPE